VIRKLIGNYPGYKKKDLEKKAQISHYTMNKLNKGENITTDILGNICKALDCSADDIMEFVFDETVADDAEEINKKG
jgi:DNA-binding Xre family transcriptional regulator